jgi:hypothetical protein
LQANGYAITVGLDATLSISDSCFINNNFVGDGIVLAQEMDDFSHSNIYGTTDDELTCAFAMIAGDCVPFSSRSCTANNGKVPVAAPSTVSPTITSPLITGEPTTTPSPTATPTRAPIPAPVPARPCFTNLTEIEDLTKLKNPYFVETYVLCPNTIFQIGVVGPNNTIVGGYNAIQPRANTVYTCGEDGKSSNNCIIRGGSYQVYHAFVTYNRENKVGVVFKGITFDDSIEGGLVLVAPGDTTFIDCVFSVSSCRNFQHALLFPLHNLIPPFTFVST